MTDLSYKCIMKHSGIFIILTQGKLEKIFKDAAQECYHKGVSRHQIIHYALFREGYDRTEERLGWFSQRAKINTQAK